LHARLHPAAGLGERRFDFLQAWPALRVSARAPLAFPLQQQGVAEVAGFPSPLEPVRHVAGFQGQQVVQLGNRLEVPFALLGLGAGRGLRSARRAAPDGVRCG
jgi:hypothetical protein